MKKILLVALILLVAFAGEIQAASENIAGTTVASSPSGGGFAIQEKFISATTAGDNEVIAAVTGKRILVWAFEVSAKIATDVYWKAGSTQITEVVYLGATGSWLRRNFEIWNDKSPVLIVPASAALNLNATTTGPVGVWVKYTILNN